MGKQLPKHRKKTGASAAHPFDGLTPAGIERLVNAIANSCSTRAVRRFAEKVASLPGGGLQESECLNMAADFALKYDLNEFMRDFLEEKSDIEKSVNKIRKKEQKAKRAAVGIRGNDNLVGTFWNELNSLAVAEERSLFLGALSEVDRLVRKMVEGLRLRIAEIGDNENRAPDTTRKEELLLDWKLQKEESAAIKAANFVADASQAHARACRDAEVWYDQPEGTSRPEQVRVKLRLRPVDAEGRPMLPNEDPPRTPEKKPKTQPAGRRRGKNGKEMCYLELDLANLDRQSENLTRLFFDQLGSRAANL